MQRRHLLKTTILATAFAVARPRHRLGRERRQAEDRLRRRDERPRRRLGHLERPLDGDARRLDQRRAAGSKIGDKTYDVEIVTFDDQGVLKRAIAGMEKMAQEGIHYVVGPNVDDGAAAVRPVAEQNGIIYFPYAFPNADVAPASNAVLGMVANYQSGPAIYKYLKENKGVQKVAFVAANESDRAEPARRRGRGGQGARPRRGLGRRDLPG